MNPHQAFRCILLTAAFCLALQQIPHAQTTLCDSSFAQYRQNVLLEMDYHNGRVVWDDETRESYCSVMVNCPTEALVRFTDDSIPAIRGAVFTGLAQINTADSILQEIFNKHRDDTAEYCSRPSSVLHCHLVNEYMNMVVDAKADSDIRTVDFQASLNELRSKLRVVVPGTRFREVPKDSLLTMDSLFCPVPGYRIVSFQFYTKKDIQSKGNHLSKRMKRHIRKLKPGDKIFFEEIKVEMPDKTLRTIAPVTLKVR